MKTKDINIVMPGPDAPGYLRRMRKLAKFDHAMKNGELTPGLVDEIVDFLASIAEGGSRDEITEAIWEMSGAELSALFAQIGGAQVPPPKGGASEDS